MEAELKCGACGETEFIKLTERVVRSWSILRSSKTELVADVDTDDVDYESGDGYSLECSECGYEWPVPDSIEMDFCNEEDLEDEEEEEED